MHLLCFDILTYWHAGTGRGAGPDLDAVIFLTPEGLPCLPGRTVKGLVRDALEKAEQAQLLPQGTALRWLGSKPVERESQGEEREALLEAARFHTTRGALRIGSAELGKGNLAKEWRAWAAASPMDREELRRPFASTRIDDNGVAQEKTLRAIEVAVPMTLYAPIGPFAPDCPPSWAKDVKQSLIFIDALGSHRNRGLGRVNVSLEEV